MDREEYRRGSTTRGRRRSSAVSRALAARNLSAASRRRLRLDRVSLGVCSRRRACRPPWATAPQQGLCALRPRQCVLASTAPQSDGAPSREGALLGQMPNGLSVVDCATRKLSMASDDCHPLLESPEPRDPRI